MHFVRRWCLTSSAWAATCCASSSTTRRHVRLADSMALLPNWGQGRLDVTVQARDKISLTLPVESTALKRLPAFIPGLYNGL